MTTLDHKRVLKELYSARQGRPAVVEVPEMQFLMYDGKGNPETSPMMQEGMRALFALAYPIRFAIKAQDGISYTVMPPEGLFWSVDGLLDLTELDEWAWTLMIMQPEYVTRDHVERARQQAVDKGVEGVEAVRLDVYDEGLAAQILHVGPYDEEAPTIALLHDFILEHGHTARGRHHEIYLGDPRRAKPENLRTIIRQPIR